MCLLDRTLRKYDLGKSTSILFSRRKREYGERRGGSQKMIFSFFFLRGLIFSNFFSFPVVLVSSSETLIWIVSSSETLISVSISLSVWDTGYCDDDVFLIWHVLTWVCLFQRMTGLDPLTRFKCQIHFQTEISPVTKFLVLKKREKRDLIHKSQYFRHVTSYLYSMVFHYSEQIKWRKLWYGKLCEVYIFIITDKAGAKGNT